MDCGLSGITFTEPSQTKTNQASDCDLKLIVARFMRTGQLPSERPGAMEGDLSVAPQSFEEVQQITTYYRQQWEQLTPDEKASFGNSLEQFALAQVAPQPSKNDPPKNDPPKNDPPKNDPPSV